MKNSWLAYLWLLPLLVACTAEENTNLEQYGLARILLSVDSRNGVEPVEPFTLEMHTADNRYSAHWDNIDEYNPVEPLYVDAYVARAVSGTPGAEGYGCQCFAGEERFIVNQGERVDVTISCSLQQAIVLVDIHEHSQRYALDALTVHTTGHGYNIVEKGSVSQPLYIQPGNTSVYVHLSDADGHKAVLAPNFNVATEADRAYAIAVTLDDDNVHLACGTTSVDMRVTDDLLDGKQPTIKASGFEPGIPLVLTQGFPASQPVVMEALAPGGIQRMDLSVQGSLSGTGLSNQYSLYPEAIDSTSLNVEMADSCCARIDFSRLLEGLIVNANSDLTFTVVVQDQAGRVSEPCSLRVLILNVELECIGQTEAVLGENIAWVTLMVNTGQFERNDFALYQADDQIQDYKPIEILDAVIDHQAHTIMLRFDIGDGIEPENVRLDFMGQPKLYLTVQRSVPPYAISVDAFATHAHIYIDAATEHARRVLTRYARVFVDGTEYTVTSRNPESGSLSIGGLRSSTRYTATTEVIKDAYRPRATFVTEREAQIPDGDFENASPSLSYNGLPCGGPYSNTPFPLYAQQNVADIDVWWPQNYWANVNAKTFCRAASNHNTWYMQPSSASDYEYYAGGHKSIRIASVGWSLEGPEIAPYAQQDGQQLPYNANVPPVDHRSAGRLFLGSYSFDPATMSEKYTEGINFTSRPRSLNGFYRFKPDVDDSNDCGIVILQLTGQLNGFEVVIASATMQFAPYSGMMAFNLPIEYHYEGVKAERLKLMFASSSHLGDIATEDAQVAVTPDLPSAAFIGSELWIDNISFSY